METNLPIYFEEECININNVHSTVAHMHDDIEIICVNKGSMTCCVENDDFSLQKGDICFINRKKLHNLTANKEMSGHLVLIVNSSLLTQNQDVYDKCILPILEDQDFGHVRFTGESSNAAEIEKLMKNLKYSLLNKEIGYELESIALLHQIFKYIYLAYINKDNKYRLPNINLQVQKNMLDFIETHYDEQITLDDIAFAGSVSRSQCSKIFKEFTNQSPINYLNSYRLEKSRDYLRNSDMSISEISRACGFSEQSYFNRLFLREFACKPLEYRKGNVIKD